MKKAFLLVLVLAAVIAGAFVYFRKTPASLLVGRAAAFAPADSIVFVELPDLSRMGDRWEKTALHQIAQEPEWKAFFGNVSGMLQSGPFSEIGRVLEEVQEAE